MDFCFKTSLTLKTMHLRFEDLLSSELFGVFYDEYKKDDAIREMLFLFKKIDFSDEYIFRSIKGIFERERIASTYLANGVAIPHARLNFIQDTYIAVGLFKKGVVWDKEIAKIVFLVLSPPKHASMYLYIQKSVVEIAKDVSKVEKVLSCEGFEELKNLISNWGFKVKDYIVAGDIMDKPKTFALLNEKISDIVGKLVEYDVTSIPVVNEENKLIGEVEENNIFKIVFPEAILNLDDISFISGFSPLEDILSISESVEIKDIMSEAITVNISTPLAAVIHRLVKYKKTRAYVVDEEGHLIGCINLRDVIKKVWFL